jgi:hypothetical protein
MAGGHPGAFCGTASSLTFNPFRAMSDEIRAYAELQKQMSEALRSQHPEWIEPNGTSPILDNYEARFAELLAIFDPPHDRKAA